VFLPWSDFITGKLESNVDPMGREVLIGRQLQIRVKSGSGQELLGITECRFTVLPTINIDGEKCDSDLEKSKEEGARRL
jgi:hypothetical protein